MNSVLMLIFEILYVITIISVVIVVISENRNPIKTLSWVMVLVFLPFAGLIWYLIFGQEFTKKQVITKRMYSKLKKRPLDEIGTLEEFAYPREHASLIRLLKNLDHTPLLGGNDVQFFTECSDKFEHLIRDIENAKKAYQNAWNALLERQQERQILQIKLESVGVLVDDPEIERPVIDTQVDETE